MREIEAKGTSDYSKHLLSPWIWKLILYTNCIKIQEVYVKFGNSKNPSSTKEW